MYFCGVTNVIAVLDEIGHGIRSGGTPRQKQRAPSQSSIQASVAIAPNSVVGPAPTTKPPTPPQSVRTATKGRNK